MNVKKATRTKEPQYSMTKHLDKVWPSGILPYVIDASISKGNFVGYILATFECTSRNI